MKFDVNTDKGKAAIALKLQAGILSSSYGDVLDTNEAAEILVSLAGDLIAAGSGSSAVQLGFTVARLKDELETQARKAFDVMGELGIN